MSVKSSVKLLPSFTGGGIEVDPGGSALLPRWMIEGLNSFLTAGLCDIVGYQESFFESTGAQALANRARTSRVAGGCYTGAPPSLVPTISSPPFSGGQCVGTSYSVTIPFKRADGPATQTIVNCTGPVLGLAIIPHPTVAGWQKLVLQAHAANGTRFDYDVSNSPPDVGWDSYSISDVAATNGPDDCGDPPGGGDVTYPPPTEVFPVPVPGQEILPPGVIEVPAPDTGINVPVGLAYGTVNFNFDGSVSFDLGGVEVNINPDFSIDVGNGNGIEESCNDEAFKAYVIDALNSLATGLVDVIDAVDGVEQELKIPLSGTSSGVLCDDSVVSSVWSGNGLAGLSAQMSSLLAVGNDLIKNQCPIEPVEPGKEILPLGSFGGLDYRAFFDVDLPARTEVVFVDANSPHDPYARASGGGLGNDDVQSRFGQVSFLYPSEGSGFAVESGSQYYSKGAYRVPEWMPSGAKVRVSLYPGARVILQALRSVEDNG